MCRQSFFHFYFSKCLNHHSKSVVSVEQEPSLFWEEGKLRAFSLLLPSSPHSAQPPHAPLGSGVGLTLLYMERFLSDLTFLVILSFVHLSLKRCPQIWRRQLVSCCERQYSQFQSFSPWLWSVTNVHCGCIVAGRIMQSWMHRCQTHTSHCLKAMSPCTSHLKHRSFSI